MKMQEQENNNFRTTLSKWRQLSVIEKIEQTESVALVSMSGDSSNQTFLEKSAEDNKLLVPEFKEPAAVGILGAGTAALELTSDIVNCNEDKQELIKREEEDSKEPTEDKKEITKDEEDNENVKTRPPECKNAEKVEDNVDSVFLRSPPPHKTRSTASTVEEEDCGIKCLYYTLQCCDCVIM